MWELLGQSWKRSWWTFLLAEPIVDIDAKHDDGLTALQLVNGDHQDSSEADFPVPRGGDMTCCLPPGLQTSAEVQSPAIAALPHQDEVVCHHH